MRQGEGFRECPICHGRGGEHLIGFRKEGAAWTRGRYVTDFCPSDLLTDDRLENIAVWARWKRFGAPWADGWADWPARTLDLLEAFEQECVVEREYMNEG